MKLLAFLIAPLALLAADEAGRMVTLNKDIAPIFQRSCHSCHPAGTSAPMPLETYNQARPWAKSIKERVTRRDMPPWHLDKTVGIRHYKNDRSLTDAEIATVSRWVDNGAPQGDAADLLKPVTFMPENQWFIGKPDLLVT